MPCAPKNRQWVANTLNSQSTLLNTYIRRLQSKNVQYKRDTNRPNPTGILKVWVVFFYTRQCFAFSVWMKSIRTERDMVSVMNDALKRLKYTAFVHQGKAIQSSSHFLAPILYLIETDNCFELGRHEWFALRCLITNSGYSALSGGCWNRFI